jgi:two-component system, NtrC family, response regulator HydG
MARKRKSLSEMDLAVLKVEYDIIVDALKKVDFDKAKAARLLGVDRKTIHNKLKMYRKYFMAETTLPA